MRTATDALRSVARYSALALGPEWEVRLSTEKGTFQRPGAQVQQVPNVQMVTQRWSQAKFVAGYQIMCYPVAMPTADQSQLEALRVLDLLWVAFAGPGAGSPTIRRPVDSQRGLPFRVPLYNYDGIPLFGPAAFAAETARDPRDFLHMEGQPEVTVTPDPGDETLYSVAANIRMSWLRSAAVPSGQPTTGSVRVGAQNG